MKFPKILNFLYRYHFKFFNFSIFLNFPLHFKNLDFNLITNHSSLNFPNYYFLILIIQNPSSTLQSFFLKNFNFHFWINFNHRFLIHLNHFFYRYPIHQNHLNLFNYFFQLNSILMKLYPLLNFQFLLRIKIYLLLNYSLNF